MPAFSFEALDDQGQTRKGVLEADTAKAARSQLRAQALVPLTVQAVGEGSASGPASSAWFTRPVFNATALAIWTRQLAGLVSSGLPLERALTALADEAEHEGQRERQLLRRSRHSSQPGSRARSLPLLGARSARPAGGAAPASAG